jgi:hypothetical protein
MNMGRRNPTVGTHPDLFESSPTRVFKPLEEMTEEELLKLPRSAFSDDEWEELDENLQAAIHAADRKRRGRVRRADIPDDEWDELDEEVQEQIRADDPESQERIEKMVAEFVKRHEWTQEPDTNYLQDSFEGDFDYYFGEMENDAAGYIERGHGRRYKELLDDLRHKFAEDYSFEQIDAAFNEAMQDRDNWTFDYNADSYSGAFFKATAYESFYIDQHDLKEIIEGMYPDEIEDALVEINHKTDLNLDLNEIEKAANRYGIEISEYAQHYADADPDWDKLEEAVAAALEDVEGEGKAAEAIDEDRIIYRFKDGGYVVDLLASELPAEGRGRGLCVGSKQFGFIQAVESGKNKIFSMRDADGTRLFTMQAILKPDGSFDRINQIKADNNELPGADDVEDIMEFLKEGLGVPFKKMKDIQDLKPALREAGLIKTKPQLETNPEEEEEAHCGFCAECNQP